MNQESEFNKVYKPAGQKMGAFRRLYFAQVRPSNFLDLQRFCKAPLQTGDALFCAQQSAGIGSREGRRWQSAEPFSCLLLSALLRDQPLLSLRLGFALYKVAAAESSEELRVKWPNDLYCREAKLGGILTRSDSVLALTGIGLNLTQAPSVLGRRTQALLPAQETSEDLVLRLIANLGTEIELALALSAEELCLALNEVLWARGEEREISSAQTGRFRARIVGLSDKGALLVEKNGKLIPLFSAELAP